MNEARRRRRSLALRACSVDVRGEHAGQHPWTSIYVRLASFRRVDPASIKDRAMIGMGAPSGTSSEALVRTTRVKPRSLKGSIAPGRVFSGGA